MNNRTYMWIALVVIFGNAAAAQSYRAQITGIVTDPSKATVTGARITAVNLATGVRETSVSNEQGIYRIPNLQPSTYSVEAEATGFKKFVERSVTLQVGDVVSLNVALQVGTLSEVVVVSGAAPLLESESASLGHLVNQRSMQELPLNLRNPLALVLLTPGVQAGPNFGAGGGQEPGRNYYNADFKLGGGRSLAQEILLDGAPNTSEDYSFMHYIPPVDSTQEFKVQLNSYSAEFGRTTGGALNIITKSGGNELKGTLYEFHRNSVLDATNFFSNRNGLKKVSFRRNQFGVNAGGPIFKNRTFFFVDYEGFRQAFPSTQISTVPIADFRNGDFSKAVTNAGQMILIYDPSTLTQSANGTRTRTPFPGNLIPKERWDPVATAALTYYPSPNRSGLTQNYVNNTSDRLNQDKWSARIDHMIGSNNRLYGRYSHQKSDREVPRIWPGDGAYGARTIYDSYINGLINYTRIFSPTTSGEIQIGGSRGHANQLPSSWGYNVTNLKLPQALATVAQPVFPTFDVGDVTGLGNAGFNNQPRNTYFIEASVINVHGRHALKMGVDERWLQFMAYQVVSGAGAFSFGRSFTQGPNPVASSTTAGYGVASFLLGAGTGGSVPHTAAMAFQRHYNAFYLQDDFKVGSRLTLNLGLRYDLDIGRTERHNRLSWFDLTATSPLSQEVGLPLRGVLQFAGTNGNSRNQLATDKNNFAPRFGLAYQFANRTVVRAGYGIFFVPVLSPTVAGVDGFSSSTPWVATIDGITIASPLNNPFPSGFNLPKQDRSPLTNVGYGLSGTIRDEPVGYAQQWNLSIQRQLTNDFLIDVAYWGNKGTKLLFGDGVEENYTSSRDLSLGSALNDLVPNPFYGIITSGSLSGPQISRRQLLRPYPQYTSVFRAQPSLASSIYHAFTLKLERRVTQGLSLQAAYTVSKAIDDSSSITGWIDQAGGINVPDNRRLERSVSCFDVPQRLVVNYVWDLPFGKDRRFARTPHPVLDMLIGRWSFSGISTFQSGIPITVGRPNNNGTSAKLDNPTVDRWFNTSVFSVVPPYTYGNVGRLLPDVRRDGSTNFDFTLSKSFTFAEKCRIQFRSEFFNAFNTPQFGDPNGGVTSINFGKVSTQANAPREIQFGLKLYW